MLYAKKINKTLFTAFLTLLWSAVFCQIPQVPSKMKFVTMDLQIDDSARAEIQKTVNKLHANPSFFNRMVEQADVYFPLIEAEFAKTGFPDQIKYLCIQESAFKPEAVSTSNAVGYWQFKEATAVEQGLLVNHQIDERKNIVSSSFAAAKYMTAHNASLNNWAFAVIAYNTGLGGVKQFYDSKYAGVSKMDITMQTHWYFLKHLAHIIAFQDYVGKKTPLIMLKVYTQTMGKSVSDFAHEHGIAVADVVPYNYWTNENKTITDKNTPVIIPIPYNQVASAETTKETLKEQKKEEKHPHKHKNNPATSSTAVAPIPASKKVESVALEPTKDAQTNYRYKVNKVPAITAIAGDNSAILALKGGIERDKFLKYNEIKNFEELIIGQTYFLQPKKGASNMLYHTTQYDETMWMIAQKYGVKETALRRKNRMSNYETTQAGRVIWLKALRPETTPIEYKELPKQKPKVIEVPKAEIKKEVIIDTFGLDTNKAISVAERPSKFTHWVQPQETLEMIAHVYQVQESEIKLWNNLSSDSLVVGSQLKIYESDLKVKIIKDTTLGKDSDYLEVYKPNPEVPNAIEVKKIETKEDPNLSIRNPTEFREILIEPGTTLYGLSRQYGVTVAEIKKYNPAITDGLSAGAKVKIPMYQEEKTNTVQTYTVRAGDTYYSISKKLGVTVEYLKTKNNKTDNGLKLGEMLQY